MFPPQTVLRGLVIRPVGPVSVRSWDKHANSDWQSLDLFQANVKEVKETTGNTVSYNTSVGIFDFSGPIELSIEPSQVSFPSIDAVRAYPLSYGLQADVRGRNIMLNLTEPANLVVEVNGDVFNVLHLFLDKTGNNNISEDQARQDSSVIYYGTGYHEPDGTVNVTSGQTVYLASGSVVQGGFNFQNTDAVTISLSESIRVGGITVLNPGHYSVMMGSSRDVVVSGLRSISADVVLENLFMRNSDAAPELMQGVTISKIDILDHRESQDILFEDIRVKDFRLGMLLSFKMLYNQKYNLGPGRGIQNVIARNLSYNGVGGNTPAIAGYNENRSIQFVDFQGLEINGEHIWDGMQKPGWYSISDFVPVYIGSHVANLAWSA
ncbi:putative endo-polygalacturonase [Aspergillus foveolatus]|uniref:putative endo-polygalacturonase n=1 Tax=Aspergillus foveolatus TaxID=210207 RepID=UPI003CCCD09F